MATSRCSTSNAMMTVPGSTATMTIPTTSGMPAIGGCSVATVFISPV
ncbi:MAG: hypothetical protein WCG99_00555 [Candidatus Berkelbacteria bacterium]